MPDINQATNEAMVNALSYQDNDVGSVLSLVAWFVFLTSADPGSTQPHGNYLSLNILEAKAAGRESGHAISKSCDLKYMKVPWHPYCRICLGTFNS